MWKELFAPNNQLFKPAFKKICFASDLYYFKENVNLDTYFQFYNDIFEKVKADENIVKKINYKNIEKLFSL